MAKEFGSIEECLRFVESQCQNGLKVVGEDIHDVLTENVDTYVYGRDPGAYQRTYDLINSISTRDYGKMYEVYFADNTGHTSLWGSDSMGISPGDHVYIPMWVNEGETWNQPPAFFYERTIEDVVYRGTIPRYVNVMMKYLKSHGIDAEYR